MLLLAACLQLKAQMFSLVRENCGSVHTPQTLIFLSSLLFNLFCYFISVSVHVLHFYLICFIVAFGFMQQLL